MTARTWRIVLLSALLATPVAPVAVARAQLIAVKTAPVADGGQFIFLPSANLGTGGLSIALADSSLDPFANPAKGARLHGMRVFGAPAFFSVSRRAGGGFTLPIGTSMSKGRWFTQLAFAMQDIDRPNDLGGVFAPGPLADASPLVASDVAAADLNGPLSRENRYAHALLGRRVGNGLAVAASASWWDINAIDGVELYYPNSQRVRQHGDAVDLRLGVVKEWRGGQTFEALALRNRFAVTQDVASTQVFWDPTRRQMVPIARVEPNADEHDTWGLHLGYTRPLADTTWRVGAIVTGNVIRQPRLPGYDLPQVPADAGRAHAYNVGGGIVRSTEHWLVGFDAIFEPIASRSWVRADRPTEARDGTTLGPGTNTLESRFRFTNAIARTGVAATLPLAGTRSLTFETGGQLRAIRYRLTQWNAIEGVTSASTQHWNEWTRSWGLTFRFAHADVHYRGNLTTGAGRPGFDDAGGIFVVDRAPPPGVVSDVSSFVGPFGLRFDKVRATTHQISFSVPIR